MNIDTSDFQSLDIFKAYKDSKYLSFKLSSYFQVYEELLAKYRNTSLTFVEIGVLNGGSLFMWRNFFGSKARIIGVDFNPQARKWEKDGFEIHIGSQSDPDFWRVFFSAVGKVDVVLDDGGHTSEQQIVTTQQCIPHINDGGMLIVEDTHTSYMWELGNPSKYSFINYAKRLIDSVNSRYPAVNASNNALKNSVYSINSYESIVCFNVDRSKCFVSTVVSNEGITSNAEDFRYHGSNLGRVHQLRQFLSVKFSSIKEIPWVRRGQRLVFGTIFAIHTRLTAGALRKYFE